MPPSARIKQKTMAKKYNKKAIVRAGVEKFQFYAEPRGLMIDLKSYGIYKVVHNGKTSELEACRASQNINGQTVTGWIINLACRQRTFKPDGSGYEVYPLKK